MSTGTVSKTKNLRMIPTNLIHESKVALRGSEHGKVEFHELAASVARNGIFNPVLVREVRAPDGSMIYGLIDGRQRWEAAKLAGLEEIPAQIRQMSEAEILEAQVIANVQKIETKPAAYSKQLQRIFKENPTMTLPDMATRLSKTTQWVKKRLELANLPDHITILVDEGKIGLSNAYAMVELARLAEDEVPNFLTPAQTEAPIEFSSKVAERVKQIREARKSGRDPNKQNVFVPQPLIMKGTELKEEYLTNRHATAVLEALGAKSPMDGWVAAFKFIFHMDPLSIEAGRLKYEERIKQEAENKEKKRLEREEKKTAEATKATAEVTA